MLYGTASVERKLWKWACNWRSISASFRHELLCTSPIRSLDRRSSRHQRTRRHNAGVKAHGRTGQARRGTLHAAAHMHWRHHRSSQSGVLVRAHNGLQTSHTPRVHGDASHSSTRLYPCNHPRSPAPHKAFPQRIDGAEVSSSPIRWVLPHPQSAEQLLP